MSMSQEEIESLMNGLDITANEESKDSQEAETKPESENQSNEDDSTIMSEDDIEALIAETNVQNENEEENSTKNEETAETSESENIKDEDIDLLLSELEADSNEDLDDDTSEISNDDIDDLINSLESPDDLVSDSSSDDIQNEEVKSDEEPLSETSEDVSKEEESALDEDAQSYLKELDGLDIDEEVENIKDIETSKEEKEDLDYGYDRYENVVNLDKINIPSQLGQVNNDSEEKATVIFDALSAVLEDNNDIRSAMKSFDEFFKTQEKLLKTLSSKFPNVQEFKDSLESLEKLSSKPEDIKTMTMNRDNELFAAMELMQFHDINRQKIERVMSVVSNLSQQLNDILNEKDFKKMSVAKHLPGDKSSDILEDDDLESLINEYSKK